MGRAAGFPPLSLSQGRDGVRVLDEHQDTSTPGHAARSNPAVSRKSAM